jgi:hypothetical protein
MNNLILISPSLVRGFQPIISSKKLGKLKDLDRSGIQG